jgi:iron(III) transport system permease protein
MTAVTLTRGALRTRRIVAGWLLLGLAAYVLLPWYFPQNLSLWRALPGVFGAADTASGLVQAWQHQRPWLWLGLAGLAVAAAGWRQPPSRLQGWLLSGGALLGLAGLLLSGFTIGATGWSFETLNGWFGELPWASSASASAARSRCSRC